MLGELSLYWGDACGSKVLLLSGLDDVHRVSAITSVLSVVIISLQTIQSKTLDRMFLITRYE